MRSTASQAATISPAMAYWFMAGEFPPARLRGWVQLAQIDMPTLTAAWNQHQAAIIAAAAPFHFQPYALTRQVPRGPGFDLWRRQFLAANQY